MTIEDISKMVFTSEDYAFLKRDPLGDNVVLIGLGGSYAYGTNIMKMDLGILSIIRQAQQLQTRLENNSEFIKALFQFEDEDDGDQRSQEID